MPSWSGCPPSHIGTNPTACSPIRMTCSDSRSPLMDHQAESLWLSPFFCFVGSGEACFLVPLRRVMTGVDLGPWSKLSLLAAKIFLVIAVHANSSSAEGGRPSMKTIALCAGISKRASIKAVNELVRADRIEITGKATTHTTNRYRVTFWRGEYSAPRGERSSPPGEPG